MGGDGGGTTGSIRAIESPVGATGAGAGVGTALGAGVVAGAAKAATGGGGAAAPRLVHMGRDRLLEGGLPSLDFSNLSFAQFDPSIRGAGDTIVNVEVNGGDPQSVVDAIQRWTRQNGPLPIAVTY